MKKEKIFRLYPGDQNLAIRALDGSRIISEAKKVFKVYIDEDFVDLGINKLGIATPETPLNIHEITTNVTFLHIFHSLPGTWDQKWLSQSQVIEFCESMPGYLSPNRRATFFLIKKDENKPVDENDPEDNLVVACVYPLAFARLIVLVYHLDNKSVWRGKDRHRVVSPQLIFSDN